MTLVFRQTSRSYLLHEPAVDFVQHHANRQKDEDENQDVRQRKISIHVCSIL